MKLTPCLSPLDDGFSSDEERYKWQSEARTNFILIDDDRPNIIIDVYKPKKSILDTNINWIKSGEIIAGSFMCNIVDNITSIEFKDIDIYFKDINNVKKFLAMNNKFVYLMDPIDTSATMVRAKNISKEGGSQELNLIYGVKYSSPEELISRFDIRACSIAYNPNSKKVFSVRGSLADICCKRIVYNPIPHNTTIARLVKYVEKGFTIDPYQRVFLAELISSDMYNTDLEISTGYRAIK